MGKVKKVIVQQVAGQLNQLPRGYASFLRELKGRIRTAQIKAALAVNSELVLLYWVRRSLRFTADKSAVLGMNGQRPS